MVGMKIALDIQTSEELVADLKMFGHEVMRASHHETDKAFFQRAGAWGAELYVSPDYDWMNYALDNKLAFLHVQQGWGMRTLRKEILEYCKGRQREAKKKRTRIAIRPDPRRSLGR